MSDEKKEAPTNVKKLEMPKTPKRIAPARFKDVAVVRNHWMVTVEAGTLPDDLLERGYWQHVAQKMRPGDRIEVLTDDMRWAGDLIVFASGRLWATVKFIGLVQFTDVQDLDATDNLKVQYRGPHHRYCVVEAEGNEVNVIRTNFDNQEDAMIFLQEYRKTVLKVA